MTGVPEAEGAGSEWEGKWFVSEQSEKQERG